MSEFKNKLILVAFIGAVFWMVILVFWLVPSYGMEATVTGSEVRVDYVEPITNEDNSNLTDLSDTRIYADKKNLAVVPATALTGGGSVSKMVVVPVVGRVEVDVLIEVTATDTSGNESDPASVTIRIDRLPPAPPQ